MNERNEVLLKGKLFRFLLEIVPQKNLETGTQYHSRLLDLTQELWMITQQTAK